MPRFLLPVALVAALLGPNLVSADWPLFRGDPLMTGASTSKLHVIPCDSLKRAKYSARRGQAIMALGPPCNSMENKGVRIEIRASFSIVKMIRKYRNECIAAGERAYRNEDAYGRTAFRGATF